jgi:dolichol-phosphate mannosyltransferase
MPIRVDECAAEANLQAPGAIQERAQVPVSPPALALVIPTLYEGANIRAMLDRARGNLDALGMPYELIVVDDDSRDGTEALVREVVEEDSRVRFISRVGERGLSGAVIRGWQNSQAEIVGVIDADFQHPPELLPDLWKSMAAGNDLALASRYVQNGEHGRWHPARHLLSYLAILLTRPLQRADIFVRDPMSGFFLVRRRFVKDLALRTSGFKILLEILVRSDVRKVAEVPFTFGLRHAGKSKAGMDVGLDYLLLLANLWKQRRT